MFCHKKLSKQFGNYQFQRERFCVAPIAGRHSLGQSHDWLVTRHLLRRSSHQSSAMWLPRHQAAVSQVHSHTFSNVLVTDLSYNPFSVVLLQCTVTHTFSVIRLTRSDMR